MFRFWWFAPEGAWESELTYPWWTALLFALCCIALGVALVVWPTLLALLVAAALIATGILILPSAVAAAWNAWKHRPRRIRVRYGRPRGYSAAQR